jgi:beta-glucanase (GH16 family)
LNIVMARVVRFSSKQSTFLILAVGLGLWLNCQVKTEGLTVGPAALSGADGAPSMLDVGPGKTDGKGQDGLLNTSETGGADANSPVGDAPLSDVRILGGGGSGGASSAGDAPKIDGAGVGGAHGNDGGTALGGDADVKDVATRDGANDGVVAPLLDAAIETGPDVPMGYADALQADRPAPAVDSKRAVDARAFDSKPAYTLVWSDEFDGDTNAGIDTTKWTAVTWAPGHVNNERQQYTASLNNVFLDGNGHLRLRARYSPMSLNAYTSARIETDGKASFGPGHRIEVRAKLPEGQGSFPGIIMLGPTSNWPQNGELALMEQYGQDKSSFYASANAGDGAGLGSTGDVQYDFSDATTASADFHVYSIDWHTDHVDFAVDGDPIVTSTFTTSSPFSSVPEYIVLDVALGGDMGGTIDNSAFPMEMVVDYVRVYAF